jgi:hypothetical protein
MMRLKIKFPPNLITESLIGLSNIPCVVRVSSVFEVFFQAPLIEAAGIVEGWDLQLIAERVIAGTGGEFSHHRFAMVSLAKMEKDNYEIIDLSMFVRHYGWCVVLSGGVYGPPKDFSDVMEDDFKMNKRVKKHR